MSTPRPALASLVLVLALGCGPGVPSTNPDAGALRDAGPALDGSIELDAPTEGSHELYARFADRVVDAMCAATIECFGHDPIAPIAGDCVMRAHELVWEEPGSPVRFDPARAEACIAALEADPCDIAETWAHGCAGALSGTLPAGTACTHDLECAGDATCAGPAGECPRCTPRAAQGERCEVARCGAGLGCALSSERSVCETLGAEGDDCVVHPCGRTLFCDTSSLRCAPVVEVGPGEVCGLGTECAQGLRCMFDGATQRCVEPVALGAPCYAALIDPCIEGAYCSGATEGTCELLPRLGEACGRGALCAGGLLCRGGECSLASLLGQACTEAADCASYACEAGRCVRRSCE